MNIPIIPFRLIARGLIIHKVRREVRSELREQIGAANWYAAQRGMNGYVSFGDGASNETLYWRVRIAIRDELRVCLR